MLSPAARRVLYLSPWLRNVPNAVRGQLARLFEERTVLQGEVLFRQGDPAAAAYLVVEGAVDMQVDGRLLARLGPGESFGMAMLGGEPRRATAVTAIDCRLLVLPEEHAASFRRLQPRFYEEFARSTARALETMLHGGDPDYLRFVALRGDGAWETRREVLGVLVDALERESGRPVAVVTLVAPGDERRVRPLRDNGLDWVLARDPENLGAARAEFSRQLAGRQASVGFVIGELHESSPEYHAQLQVDVLIQRVRGDAHPEPHPAARQTIFLCDAEGGPPLDRADRIALPDDEPGRSRAMERLARRLCGHTVGLALGSGAAWGMAHIGVLEVLEEAGIPVDLVSGASMGAIVGAHYALGIPPADLHAMATRVKTLGDFVGILPELLYLAADFNLVKPGLFAGEHFKKVLASIAPIRGRTFGDLALPFRAVATDLETGARAEIRDGELAEAVHASFAAPGVLSPCRIGDSLYIDGGMVDPVPADTARRMGADLVIAVNVVPPLDPEVRNPQDRAFELLGRLNPLARLRRGDERRVPGALSALYRTIQLMQHQLGNDRAGDADVLIEPRLQDCWILEFWAAERLIERGAEATRQALPAIRERLAAWQKSG